jgi:hypothetical protein
VAAKPKVSEQAGINFANGLATDLDASAGNALHDGPHGNAIRKSLARRDASAK